MESFSTIIVTYSIILGLGITNLLNSFMAMFRSRGQAHLHWMPLVWAFCIFTYQVQFWWAIIQLKKILTVFTLGNFLILMMIALMLFIASAMIIPDNELKKDQNLLDEFYKDGKWALMIMSLYAATAAIVDYIFWGMGLSSREMAFLGFEFFLPILLIYSKKLWLQELITVVYAINCIISNICLSPVSYT